MVISFHKDRKVGNRRRRQDKGNAGLLFYRHDTYNGKQKWINKWKRVWQACSLIGLRLLKCTTACNWRKYLLLSSVLSLAVAGEAPHSNSLHSEKHTLTRIILSSHTVLQWRNIDQNTCSVFAQARLLQTGNPDRRTRWLSPSLHRPHTHTHNFWLYLS